VRVYVPATVPMLRRLVDEGELHPLNGTAFALTPALRESYAAGDTEELEYAAMLDAARASLRLLSVDPDAPPRRAVLSADADGVQLRPDLDYSVVRMAGPVTMRLVAAAHVDSSDAEDAVREAVKVVDAADLGDPDAEFIIGSAEDHELAWYAPQELPFLLDLM
jgi:hypothetical protein